jgi:AmmeMemoRadiSam system protein A/AmmeMemoRadiSam system protein B
MSILGAVAVPHPPLIIPSVGQGREDGIGHTIIAYQKAMQFVSSLKPKTVVIVSPHATAYQDYLHMSSGDMAEGDFSAFGAPDEKVTCRYDMKMVELLEELCAKTHLSAGSYGERVYKLDHGTAIPLYFLNKFYKDYEVVRIGISGLSLGDHYRLGMLVKEASELLDKRVVFIASGDLSHKLKDDGPYGYSAHGPVFDKKIVEIFKNANFLKLLSLSPHLCESAAECGHRSFVMMAGALDRMEVTADFLSYEGPFGVGYAVATFLPSTVNNDRDFLEQYENSIKADIAAKRKQASIYVRLALYTMEYFQKERKNPPLPDFIEKEGQALLANKAGVFVSIKKFHELRGCIGTILPVTDSVAEEIMRNAIEASNSDPRFPPITYDELPYLEVSVDVLSQPQRVDSIDELDAKRYGVIVRAGNKCGLLLPNLEGVDTVNEQIRICRQKGRIGEDETVTLERFEVVRYY